MAITPRTIKPGAVIDGFVVQEPIRSGAMGEIFRVTKVGIDRPMVMKVPRLGPHQPAEGLVSFETEAMILPTLKGPQVPAFVAAGPLEETPYLVTEWIEGENLEDIVGRDPLSPGQIAEVGAALADAIHGLHQQEVSHLDIKPENAILRSDGTVGLVDLGFAHHARLPDLLAEETRFGVGSAPYVSPEQLLGARNDPRSDLFALGVVLYELATGRLPFGEPDSDVRNRFWLDPVPPSAIASAVPPWMQEIILRCLEPRADRRYQSAAHVAFDLRHPEQVLLTERASKRKRVGVIKHLRRFLRARAEHGPSLRSPPALPGRVPIVLVALETAHIDDERHPAIRLAVSQILARSKEYRLICLTVIPPSASSLEHLVRLRHWAAPLGLPMQRLSLHAVESSTPGEVIVELARHNNADLVVVGAPTEAGRAWSQSVASTVAERSGCSVHIVRIPHPTGNEAP
jgi:eukaryotic-like serine/threonine-protein kinase